MLHVVLSCSCVPVVDPSPVRLTWSHDLLRLVVLSVVLFGLPYGSDQSCSVTLVDHGRGYLGILVSCLICESAIMWLSMRGSILYTQPREAVQYVLYIRLGKTSSRTHVCPHAGSTFGHLWVRHQATTPSIPVPLSLQRSCWWSWCTLWWESPGSSSIISHALMSRPRTWRWVSRTAREGGSEVVTDGCFQMLSCRNRRV